MNLEDQINYINAHLNGPIVIIGMMGAGKTTLARELSSLLGREYIDSDHEIEKDENISVKEIFETRGEAYFREKEREKIFQLLESARKIISVGGGAITSPETADNIFTKSLSLWANAPIDILVQRTAGHGNRPLLNGADAKAILTERMQQRKHLYNRARLHVDASASIDVVAINAIGQMYKYLKEKADEI